MSMPAAPKTTCLVNTFISGLSPLLRTANSAARTFELHARRYPYVSNTTRLGKYCPPRYRAQSSHEKGDENFKWAAPPGFSLAGGLRSTQRCRENCAQ